MPQDHLGRIVSGKFCRRHKVAVLQGQGLAPRHAGILRPADDRQRNHRITYAPAKQRCNRQRKDQARKRQADIRNPHHNRIDPAPKEAAERSRQGSEYRGNANEYQRGENTGLRSHNYAGENIPAVLVRSHKMGWRRRLSGQTQILRVRVIGNNLVRKKRNQHQDHRKKQEKKQTRPDPVLFYFLHANRNRPVHCSVPPSLIRGSRYR